MASGRPVAIVINLLVARAESRHYMI